MSKTMSPAQLEANRLNAQHSTGPKTPEGKAASSLNAFKHGLRSGEVVIRGSCLQEDNDEFEALHERLWDDLQPVGALEEILVDQIATTHWRLRRALKAESGEITLNVDSGQYHRSNSKPLMRSWFALNEFAKIDDPVAKMRESSLGNSILENILEELLLDVENEGVISEAAFKKAGEIFRDTPNSFIKDLERVRARMEKNEDGMAPERIKAWALSWVNSRLEDVLRDKAKCEDREKIEEQARQSAQALPAPEVIDKLMRYIKALERQLFQSMNQLERLQRRRQGENVPPPLAVQVSTTE
jgi:hypothetical protein